MQKKLLVIILAAAFCAAMITGCAGKNWIKNTGTYPTKTITRAGGLPDLVVDPRINDMGAVKEQVRTAKTKQDSAKQKSSTAVKEAEENLPLALTIEFDFAKHVVRDQYNDDIKKVADTMKENPETKAVIKGHTDSIGSKAYNMVLSKARANSLKKYIVEKFGVAAARIKTIGYGFSRPTDSNDTEEGRQKNRRDEVFIKELK